MLTSPPEAPSGTAILAAYNFGPDGAIFDPPLTLSFAFSTLPGDMDENSLSVAYYDGIPVERVSFP